MAASFKNLARSPLAHRVVSSLLANGVRVVLQAGTGLILARALGVSALGTYAWAMAISAILVVPAQFGTSTLLMKEGAAAKANGDHPKLKTLWIWTIKVTALASLVSITALVAIFYFAQDHFAALDWRVFIVAVAVVPFAVLINLGEAALQGTGHTSSAMLPGYYVRPVLFVAMLVSLWASTMVLDPYNAMLAQLAAHILAAIVVVYQMRRIHREVWAQGPAESVDHSTWRDTAWSFLLIHGQWVILAQMDILILGAMSSADQVGLYRVAFLAAGFILIGTMAMRGVFSERLSNAWATGDIALFRDRAALGCILAACIGLPLAALYLFAGEEFLTFAFGEEYGAAETILVVLSLGQLVLLIRGNTDTALAMTGHERSLGRMTTVSVVINLVLNLTLIPRYGAVGAAAATATALTAQSLFMWLLTRKLLGIDMSIFASVMPTLRYLDTQLRRAR